MVLICKKLKRISLSLAFVAICFVATAFTVSAYDANTKVLKQYEQKESPGTISVGIYGSYIDDITNAVNRVNAIRKEACDEGVWDPRNSSRKLTPADYVPIKWSHELEEIARLRAAEAAIYIGHQRPNGKSCFTVESPVTFYRGGEVLAWNYSNNMVSGINQFYSEKNDWQNKNNSAVTGHYTQMIDPSNTYMGLGCFYSDKSITNVMYPNTLCGRFSNTTSTTTTNKAISNCYVPVQVQTSKLSDAYLKPVSESYLVLTRRVGDTASYELWANANYNKSTKVLLYNASWKSSDTAVATVDKYGKITAVGSGSVTITATCGEISKSISFSVIERPSISKCTINLNGTSFNYTGSPITPAVTVTYDGVKLKASTDYTLTFKSNINLGTASVTITGKGDYTGSVTKTFKIVARPISSLSIALNTSEYKYDGKPKTPSVTVKFGSTVLKAATDYTVTYKNNTQVGTGTVTVTGKGNYTGSKTFSFKIYPDYDRLSGVNRYLTSVDISKKSYTSAKTVVIASGENYADALAGVPLAKAYDAPLLLVAKELIFKETCDEIVRLRATNAIILGGEGAVGKSVKDKLDSMGLITERLDGTSRFETAEMIAKKLAAKKSAPKSVYFVYFNDFPDALSISSVAAIEGSPILYVRTTGELDKYTKKFITDYKSTIKNAYVIGGTSVISSNMCDNIKSCIGLKPERVDGNNRYETCVAVNNKFASLFKSSAICVATGKQFPDALSGGVFAALKGAQIFLADQTILKSQTSYLKTKVPQKIFIFGGESAVPGTIVQSIRTNCT